MTAEALIMRTDRELVEDFYKSIIEGDMDLYSSVIHDDFELSMPVRDGVLSGTYAGKHRLVGEVFPYVIAQIDNDNFTFCKTYKIMSQDTSCTVAICEAEGLAASGERYDQIYAHFFSCRDGQIIRLIEFSDTGLADRALWGNVPKLKADTKFTY